MLLAVDNADSLVHFTLLVYSQVYISSMFYFLWPIILSFLFLLFIAANVRVFTYHCCGCCRYRCCCCYSIKPPRIHIHFVALLPCSSINIHHTFMDSIPRNSICALAHCKWKYCWVGSTTQIPPWNAMWTFFNSFNWSEYSFTKTEKRSLLTRFQCLNLLTVCTV